MAAVPDGRRVSDRRPGAPVQCRAGIGPGSRGRATFAFVNQPYIPLLAVPLLIVVVVVIFTVRKRRKYRNFR